MTTGVCITVNGEPVAWFKELNEAAEAWCSLSYPGAWLASPAVAKPLPRVFNAEELAMIEKLAGHLRSKMRPPRIAD